MSFAADHYKISNALIAGVLTAICGNAAAAELAAKDGKYVEKIYDVAVSDHRRIDPVTHRAPALASTVDLATAKYANTVGAAELAVAWRDPDFDPALPAVYYVRVLEISTPRWTTIAAVKRGAAPPDGFPATIQERA